MFDEMIGLQMAYNVIELMIYAVRSNSSERILKDGLEKLGIMFDLNGAVPVSDTPKVTGLKQRVEKEMKKVAELFYPKVKAQTINLAEC